MNRIIARSAQTPPIGDWRFRNVLLGVGPPDASPGTPSPSSPRRTSARSVPRGSHRRVELSAPAGRPRHSSLVALFPGAISPGSPDRSAAIPRPLTGPRIGPRRGPLIPPLMGPPGVGDLGEPAVARFVGQTLESARSIDHPSMGLLRRPTPGEMMEGGRLGRPCGPGAHSRASQKTNLRLRRHSIFRT